MIGITAERANEIFSVLVTQAGGKPLPESQEEWADVGFKVNADLGTNASEVLFGTGVVKSLNEAKEFLIGSLLGYMEAVVAKRLDPSEVMQAALSLGVTIGLAAGAKPHANEAGAGGVA